MPDSARKKNIKFYKQLLTFFKYLKPYWLEIGISYLMSFLSNGVNLIIPLVMMALIDSLKKGMSINVLLLLILFYITISLFSIIIQYLEQLLNQYCSGFIILNIKNDLYKHVLDLPMWYFTKETPAQLLNKINNDTGAFAIFINGTLKKYIINVFNVVAILYIARNIGTEYLLIVVISTILFYIVTLRFSKYQRNIEKTNSQTRGNIFNILLEAIGSIDIVKAYLTEDFERNKFYNASIGQINIGLNSLRIRFKRMAINQVVDLFLFAFIYGYGGYQVIIGKITIGGLIAINQYTQQLRSGLSSFGSQYEGLAAALGQLERVIDIFNIVPETRLNADGKYKPVSCKGNVVFDNVSFSYEKDEIILEKASFEINPGEKVLFVGNSGIGKTTVIKLLLRYYKPDSGTIYVDKYDISTLDISAYRGEFGVVLQEMKLFSGTIRDNIIYGCNDISEEKIINATKMAQIHEFIDSLPDKYETKVNANFAELSGGQKQRMFLARAILKNPTILIFDEAFNSLDSKTDIAIKESLNTVFADTTCIIIAHDKNSYNYVDKIYLIENKLVTPLNNLELIKL